MTSSIHRHRSSVVFYAAVAVIAIAYANPKTANADSVFEIRENDERGMVAPDGRISWDLIFRNNSNVLPEANPFNESIQQCRLYDVYSDTIPSFDLPNLWTGIATDSEGDNYWNIQFTALAPPAYITPGMSKDFQVFTTLPAGYTYDDLIIGDPYGQGRFESEGWSPVDYFRGPVGVMPLPDTNGDDIVDAADYGNLVEQLGGPPDNEESADFNGDGFVDLEDFARLRSKYGFGVASAPEFGASAPEPTALTLLTLSGLAMLRWRRAP